jgi:hypothetical protein
MSDATHIDLDTVSLIGNGPPLGSYEVELIDVLAATSKAGKPMLKATWEINEGSYKGLTLIKYYSLSTFVNKKTGAVGCMGVSEIKTEATNLGQAKKLPSSFPLDAESARKVYAKTFTGVKAKAVVREEEYTDKDTGELKTKKSVTLLPPTSGVQASTSSPSYA